MRIREAELRDAEAIARVSVESHRATYRGIIPEKSLMELTYEESCHGWADAIRIVRAGVAPGHIYVAESDKGIIGVAMGGPERSDHPIYTGEVYFLYLLPEEEREDTLRQLIIRVVERLLEQEKHSLLIRVLACNTAARRFYEALGGELVKDLQEQFEEAGMVQGLVAYGWRDVSGLLSKRSRE